MRSLQAPTRAQVLIGALAALSLLGGIGGCSFTYASAPPPNHQSMPSFDCTSTWDHPVEDLLLVGASVPVMIWATTDDPDASATVAVVSAVVAGMALASAVHGFAVTKHCIEAKSALQARALLPPTPSTQGQPAAPRHVPDPWLSAGPPPPPAPSAAPDGGAP